MKFMAPEKWAHALVKRQGIEDAARIALREARPLYGSEEPKTANPNIHYFKTAYNWIKKRYKVTAKTSEPQQ